MTPKKAPRQGVPVIEEASIEVVDKPVPGVVSLFCRAPFLPFLNLDYDLLPYLLAFKIALLGQPLNVRLSSGNGKLAVARHKKPRIHFDIGMSRHATSLCCGASRSAVMFLIIGLDRPFRDNKNCADVRFLSVL
jgi:hypothetical protein